MSMQNIKMNKKKVVVWKKKTRPQPHDDLEEADTLGRKG